MRFYILETLEESDKCRDECYREDMVDKQDQSYVDGTPRWSYTRQRLNDGKYIVPVCAKLIDYNYTVEEDDSSWYPEI